MIMIWRLQLSLVRTLGEGYAGIASKQMLWIALGFGVLWLTLLGGRDLRLAAAL